MSPTFTIQRWPLGWTISSPSAAHRGIPIDALNQCLPLIPKKHMLDYIVDTGIAHHLHVFDQPLVVMCITSKSDSRIWREHITKSIASFPPEKRWWLGLDVGLSSATIFSVFASCFSIASQAQNFANGATPADSADLGRCIRLLNLFPSWRSRLREVATLYPDTHWPQIIAHWEELESSTPEQQTRLLRTLTQGSLTPA